MKKIQVLLLGIGVFYVGLAIVTGNPLSSKVMGWVWITWGIATLIGVFMWKNAKWW